MSGPQSMRSQIAELHAKDCHMPQKEIARIVGCEINYVGVCYSQLGLTVGCPYTTKPKKERERHPQTTARTRGAEGSKHQYNPTQPWKSSAPVRYETCQYITLKNWPHGCGKPSFGRQKCPECEKKSMASAPRFHGGLTRRGADA
jgi:hypothetical protein